MAHRRSAYQQADEFVATNRHFKVVAEAKDSDGKGVRYKLTNNKWYRLGAAASRLLPEGYPRW